MRRLLSLVVWLLLPPFTWGQVTFDQAASGNTGANLSEILTYNMTIAAGNNRVLLVALCTANGVNPEVQIATFDEEPLTLIADIVTSLGNIAHLYLYVLVNPPVTTGSIELTVPAASPRRMTSGAIALHGGHQTTPHDTAVENENAEATTTLSVSVATMTAELLIDALCHRDTSSTLTMDAASGRTQRYTNASSSATSGQNVRMNGSTRTGTGTLPLGWTLDNVDSMTEIGVNINAAPAAPVGRALSLGIRMLQ